MVREQDWGNPGIVKITLTALTVSMPHLVLVLQLLLFSVFPFNSEKKFDQGVFSKQKTVRIQGKPPNRDRPLI